MSRGLDQGEGGGRAGRRGAFARLLRLGRWGAGAALLSAAAFAVGFVWFVTRIPHDETVLEGNADGIVVLTGGASRIADAIELLAAGRGKRLLISGVNRTTTSGEIARLTPAFERYFDCCIDLDRSAVNTVGNAVETRRWAKEQGFRSLIVVTSSYHMPRSMAELSRQLPDVRLIAFPVVTDKLRPETLWTSPPALRLLVSEYVKFVLAQVRMRIEPAEAASGLAGGGAHRKG